MANVKLLVPIVLKWEGRQYTETPGDLGGATKDGITLATWQSQGYDENHDGHIDKEDVKLINDDDFAIILKKYWDSWQGDLIHNQSIANILVDWIWGSGKWGKIIPQRILGVKDDGIIGNGTITALNAANQQDLFNKIFQARKQFLQGIVDSNPSQSKFLQGWQNRLNDFHFVA
jgi:lysozyme family protein